jgi:hypothetical protein
MGSLIRLVWFHRGNSLKVCIEVHGIAGDTATPMPLDNVDNLGFLSKLPMTSHEA